MKLGSLIGNLFAVHKIADREALRAFLESRAAYLVQKSITEYSQARANMLFSTLMREPIFMESYERARWQSYPAAISMVAEMAEGTLRERTGTAPGALDAGLIALVREVLAQYPGPSGLGESFWLQAGERVSRDLARAALAVPRPVRNIPSERAHEIFEALPAAKEIKAHDFPMFHNTIRFHLTELKVEFEEKADFAALAAALAA